MNPFTSHANSAQAHAVANETSKRLNAYGAVKSHKQQGSNSQGFSKSDLGEVKENKKDVEDFEKNPWTGHMATVRYLMDQILVAAASKKVIQFTDDEDVQMEASACFTKDNFWHIIREKARPPRHAAGETEQQSRDVDAEIKNWELDAKRNEDKNATHLKFYEYFFDEPDGWLRKRISSVYWATLLKKLVPMEPRNFWLELERISELTGEVNATISDNQRFSAVFKPWSDVTVPPHEFLDRYFQAFKKDMEIPLSDGSVFKPDEDDNWSDLLSQLAWRNLYRMITLPKVFTQFRLPSKYDTALENYFNSELSTSERLYSDKVQSIITFVAKQETKSQVWEGPRQKQVLLPRHNAPGPPITAAILPKQQGKVPMTTSVRQLVRRTSDLTNAQIAACSPEHHNGILVQAVRSQIAAPVPVVDASGASKDGSVTTCECGSADLTANCVRCLVGLEMLASAQLGVPSTSTQSFGKRKKPASPPQVSSSGGAAVASPSGLQPNLQAIAEAAAARVAQQQSPAAAGPSSSTRNFAKKVRMFRISSLEHKLRMIRLSRLDSASGRVTSEYRRLFGNADHESFLLDSGSQAHVIQPQHMLKWEPHTSTEFPDGFMSGETCSGEPLTLLGSGSTIARWPNTVAVAELQQPLLSVSAFTQFTVDQDVIFPALSRGLPYGAIISDAKSGLVQDVADHDYLVTPDVLPHSQRGAPLRVTFSVESVPLAAVQTSTPLLSVARMDSSEFIRQEGGLAVYEDTYLDPLIAYDSPAGNWESDEEDVSGGDECLDA